MIAIIGATGNVGRELVEQLCEVGQSVRVVTRDEQKVAPLGGRVELVVGDLRDPRTSLAHLRALTGCSGSRSSMSNDPSTTVPFSTRPSEPACATSSSSRRLGLLPRFRSAGTTASGRSGLSMIDEFRDLVSATPAALLEEIAHLSG